MNFLSHPHYHTCKFHWRTEKTATKTMSWQGAPGAGEGTKMAGLEAVKTKTSKGKREGEIRLQMRKDQCWQGGHKHVLRCRRKLCISGNCQQKQLHFSCKHFYRALYEMVTEHKHTVAFSFKEMSSIQVPTFISPSYFTLDFKQSFLTFCVQTIHDQMLNTSCRICPLLTAGIHDLHSTASFWSSVSQSTVVPSLAGPSHVKAVTERNISCF